MKFFYLVIVFLSSSCAKVNFTSTEIPGTQSSSSVPTSPQPATSPTPAPPQCVGTISQTTEKLRIIFMVDNSGSTLLTDPSQSVRVQTIKDFLAKYQTKTNFTYGFGYFATDTFIFNVATQKFVDVSKKALPASAFGTSSDLSSALSTFTKIQGDGETNYADSLASVQQMILQDPAAQGLWNYVLVFMSDGQPTDIFGNVVTDLKKLIDQVSSAAKSRAGLVTTSTVLFDPSSDSEYSQSVANLNAMATEGAGQFFDTNFPPAGGLEIDDIISVPGESCP